MYFFFYVHVQGVPRTVPHLFGCCGRGPLGALGFHGLRVWQILALGLWDLLLNRVGSQVLRCVGGCGFGHFLCLGFEYLTQKSYFVRFSKSEAMQSE